MPPDKAFLQELRATFQEEAREHLEALSRGVFELEQSPAGGDRAGIVEPMFRAAHSLKGAARAVDLRDIETVCQGLEDVFASLRRGGAPLSAEGLDALHAAVRGIESLLAPAAGAATDAGALRSRLRRLVGAGPAATQPGFAVSAGARRPPPVVPDSGAAMPSSAASPAPMAPHAAPDPAAMPAAGDSVRVAMSKLETQLLDTEELLGAKLAAGERLNELRELDSWFRDWRKAWAAVGRQPSGEALAAFSAWNRDAVHLLETRIGEIARAAQRDHAAVSKSVDTLLDSAKQLLLLPFSTISASFARVVRDLCREQGKEADLVIEGGHVELDKHILEELKDPLIHMLRNAVGHGIELPGEREAAGKKRRATLTLSVAQAEGNRVQILLADDGRGIAADDVRAAAVRRGVLTPDQAAALDEGAALALVFRGDVTTGEAVTRLSGRGLGLAIVQERARRLGGDVAVESEPGHGTAFHITVPATRATFRGILCEAAGQVVLLPVTRVERVARVAPGAITTVEGRAMARLADRTVPLVRLADVLELAAPPSEDAPRDLQVVLAGAGEQLVAFAVDAVLEEQEVLVRPLRKPLVRVRNVAGAAVLGSGQVVPVLNVSDLLLSARRTPATGVAPAFAPVAADTRARHTVLVVEDSITSRMLLKSILEGAGYAVKTAADGLEAFALLRSEPFDLVVSDVEMPRLGGFDLTARVRADKKLSALPVVLVTALATREDRERGIDVGANAYIVKGSFDQDDLLETVRRLL
jgi:two-component system chemotaxis sensor kinase CheA